MAEGNSSKQSDLPRGLIGRRGLPMGRGARLPSIGKPRDLTLGGIPKKVFTPKIPVRRDKSQESGHDEKEVKKEVKIEKRSRDNNRGRGRGRGRGQDIIQSHSIFEQGPNEKTNRSYSYSEIGSGGGGRSSGGTERSSGSKLSIKKEKTDVETKQALDFLLRDDFIDDKNSNDLNMTPVQLPLCKVEAMEIKEEKPDVISKMDTNDGLDDKSLVIAKKFETLKPQRASLTTDVVNLFSNKTEPGELLFFQFPDAMPGIPAFHGEEEKSKSKTDNKKEEQLSTKFGACSLSDFSEGHMGKMVIRKSGKTQLFLGNIVLDVTMGTKCGFLQDVVSVQTNEEGGNMSVLGHVQHRLVCTPDFDSLLQTS